ncbi:hypothetical protein A33M_4106 [Rhodovulum sp. PH10]|uniref:MBL fold metallo-hydrolase n=1 Tax=Rhodovulum sp. PH10 TaxID=1187851 RepID=UPI00027C280A|nr:MBL fold metallo-hydrolase [Rhodovulum sp. PH10]EJW10705.1 hypothetical protein A33M_4106 [Rhodovulum sp. PH10]
MVGKSPVLPPVLRPRAGPIRLLALATLAAILLGVFAPATAQQAAPSTKLPLSELPDGCPGLVSYAPRAVPASLRTVALEKDQLRLTFVGHATFLIESPQLVRVATDYNDWVRPPVVPDIATMNHAHSSHYTLTPDPAIAHVLHGWRDDGQPAAHDLTVKDVHVRSVATNIRTYGDGTERHGNSIFIVATANLCIAHLGHLHHTLTPQQLGEIGRVDVVLVPVDGSYTLDVDGMVEVLRALNAPLMIPMHYFGRTTLDRFLARIRDTWEVEFSDTPSVVLSKATLPTAPKVLVLPGR